MELQPPLNFKTVLEPPRNRFMIPRPMDTFMDSEHCSVEQFRAIYHDLECLELFPFTKSEPENTKTKETSCELRLQGDEEFPWDLEESLEYYNKSIAAAPYPSFDDAEEVSAEELALGFANRSAVYAEMKQYKSALKDIEQALFFQYPDNLKYKLFERRTECYQELGRTSEAAKSCQEAINYLPLAEAPPTDKMASLSLTLGKLSMKTKKSSKPPKDRADPTEITFVPKKAYGDHKEIPGASDCLDIIYTKEFGHHAVSTRDINPGDILLVEEPFASVLYQESYYTHCHNCTKPSDAMIPCKSCSLVMFCSEECRKLAWDDYHKIECRILPILNEEDIGHEAPLALRMLLVALSKYAGNSLYTLWDIVHELEEANINMEPKSGFAQSGQPYPPSSGYAAIHYLDRERLFPEEMRGYEMLDNCLFVGLITALVVNCLECYTDFFDQSEHSEASPVLGRPSTTDLKFFAGRLMMRYHHIILANARPYGDFLFDPDEVGLCFMEFDCAVSVLNILSFFNHSCYSNGSIFYFNGRTAYMVANQPIKKGDQVFINYGCQFYGSNLQKRTSFLLEKYTMCCCEACLNDWTTADKMEFGKLDMICSKCRTPMPSSNKPVVRCPKCRVKKNAAYVTQVQRSLMHRMKVLDRQPHTRSCLTKDLVPELSKYLIFMCDNFKMPNLLTLRVHFCLTESFRRYSNYSGEWYPEPSLTT